MNRIPVGTTLYKDGLCYVNSDIRGSSTRDVWKPQAINRNGFVYFTWVDYKGSIYVTKFKSGAENATSKLIATRPEDYDNPEADIEHSVPTMCIDNDGYIYIFYGCHDTPLFYRKSTNPEDISSWSAKLTISAATNATYPNPIVTSDNVIWVIYRTRVNGNNKKLNYATSSNGGTTWSSQTDLVAPIGSYWTYPMGIAVGVNNSIHIFSALRDNVGSEGFPYPNYTYTTDGGTTWRKADGSAYTLPITESNCDVISAGSCYPGDIKVNSANVAYLCYNTGKVIKFAKWGGSAWSITTVASVATHDYEASQLDIITDNIIDIYTAEGTNASTQGGNIHRYRSTDAGATWSLAEEITQDAISSLKYYYPHIVINHDDNTKVIYMKATPTVTLSNIWTDFEFKTYP